MNATSPTLCTNSAEVSNSSSLVTSQKDEELLSILEEGLQHNKMPERIAFKGYFCSYIVFNLSRKVLSEAEIKTLEKGLNFAPIQNKINEPEQRKDFKEFCRRMRIKWYFRNDFTPQFSEIPAFTPNSKW